MLFALQVFGHKLHYFNNADSSRKLKEHTHLPQRGSETLYQKSLQSNTTYQSSWLDIWGHGESKQTWLQFLH